MYRAKISGVGHFVPENVVTNFDLEKMMDTSDEWIRERTGIKERRWIDEKDNNADLAERASRNAIAAAGIEVQDIDFIIFATLSSEHFFPGPGCFLQAKLGLPGIGALDIRNQCSGFIYGLSVADQYIKTGMYKNILLVGSEVQSRGLNYATEGRDIAVIFGDGAGAAVVSRSKDENTGILATHVHADGNHARELWQELPGSCRKPMIDQEMVKQPGIYPYMNGRYVFKHAVTKFPEVIYEALETAGIDKSEVDLVIPHQANQRITEAVRMKLELTEEKVYSNIAKYGNTTAASIPLAISEAIEEEKIKEGSLVCLAAFGSGFTWASALIRF
jgi:3-oxoacyl-[acyl-carrier-protein] synthase-3